MKNCGLAWPHAEGRGALHDGSEYASALRQRRNVTQTYLPDRRRRQRANIPPAGNLTRLTFVALTSPMHDDWLQCFARLARLTGTGQGNDGKAFCEALKRCEGLFLQIKSFTFDL